MAVRFPSEEAGAASSGFGIDLPYAGACAGIFSGATANFFQKSFPRFSDSFRSRPRDRARRKKWLRGMRLWWLRLDYWKVISSAECR